MQTTELDQANLKTIARYSLAGDCLEIPVT